MAYRVAVRLALVEVSDSKGTAVQVHRSSRVRVGPETS